MEMPPAYDGVAPRPPVAVRDGVLSATMSSKRLIGSAVGSPVGSEVGWAVGWAMGRSRLGKAPQKKKDTASKQAASPACVRCGRAPASRGQYEPSNR